MKPTSLDLRYVNRFSRFFKKSPPITIVLLLVCEGSSQLLSKTYLQQFEISSSALLVKNGRDDSTYEMSKIFWKMDISSTNFIYSFPDPPKC